MTNKEFEQAEKELSGIEKMLTTEEIEIYDELRGPLEKFAEKYGMHKVSKFDISINEWVEQMFERAHTFLQTKMMLNACVSAKRSCRWAATAATIAILSLPAFWITVYLTLKGI